MCRGKHMHRLTCYVSSLLKKICPASSGDKSSVSINASITCDDGLALPLITSESVLRLTPLLFDSSVMFLIFRSIIFFRIAFVFTINPTSYSPFRLILTFSISIKYHIVSRNAIYHLRFASTFYSDVHFPLRFSI